MTENLTEESSETPTTNPPATPVTELEPLDEEALAQIVGGYADGQLLSN